MYYQIRTKELTLGNASVLGTHPKKIKNVSLDLILKKKTNIDQKANKLEVQSLDYNVNRSKRFYYPI